jgi:hypothetical protein
MQPDRPAERAHASRIEFVIGAKLIAFVQVLPPVCRHRSFTSNPTLLYLGTVVICVSMNFHVRMQPPGWIKMPESSSCRESGWRGSLQ